MESNLKAENLFIILDNIKPHWADCFQNFDIHGYVAISMNNILYTTCIMLQKLFWKLVISFNSCAKKCDH